MFTGLIEEVGTIAQIGAQAGHFDLRVSARRVIADAALGDSIAVEGVCLTVTDLDADSFSVRLAPETLRRTHFETANAGDAVNLERSLKASDRLGGHIVQGHIDGVGRIRSLEAEGDALDLWVDAPETIRSLIVEKGYIAIDGASLTVTGVDRAGFAVTLIDYTRGKIALSRKSVGASVNLEIDILAKTMARLLEPYTDRMTLEREALSGAH